MTERTREWIQEVKWVSLAGWLGASLEMGWEAQTLGKSLEQSRCSFASRGVSWGGSVIGFRCPLDPSLGWRSRLVPPGRGPEADPKRAFSRKCTRILENQKKKMYENSRKVQADCHFPEKYTIFLPKNPQKQIQKMQTCFLEKHRKKSEKVNY